MAFRTIRLPFKAADPFIMQASDGRYYLYCTNEDGGGFYNKLVLEVDDIVASGNVKVGNAVSTGQFTTNDGQIVWVTNGIITDITW